MLADAAGSSENADGTDLLNSESEHSEEEELNPDDFSEDVSRKTCGHAFFYLCDAIQAHQQSPAFIQLICNFGLGALPEHSKSSLPCDARLSPFIHE